MRLHSFTNGVVAVFVLGSAITFLLAYYLWASGNRKSALGVIVASPFPCPSGLPC